MTVSEERQYKPSAKLARNRPHCAHDSKHTSPDQPRPYVALRSKHDAHSANGDTLSAERDRLAKELEAANKARALLEKQLAALRASNGEFDGERKGLLERIAALEDELRTEKQNLATANTSLAALKAQLGCMKHKVSGFPSPSWPSLFSFHFLVPKWSPLTAGFSPSPLPLA